MRQWYCSTLKGSGATIEDFTHYGTWIAGLSSLEGTMTITVACLPFLKPAFVGGSRCRGGGGSSNNNNKSSHVRSAGAGASVMVDEWQGDDDGNDNNTAGGARCSPARGWLRGWSYKGIGSVASTTFAATQVREYELEEAVIACPAALHRVPFRALGSEPVRGGGDDTAAAAGDLYDQAAVGHGLEKCYCYASSGGKESPAPLVMIARVSSELSKS